VLHEMDSAYDMDNVDGQNGLKFALTKEELLFEMLKFQQVASCNKKTNTTKVKFANNIS